MYLFIIFFSLVNLINKYLREQIIIKLKKQKKILFLSSKIYLFSYKNFESLIYLFVLLQRNQQSLIYF